MTTTDSQKRAYKGRKAERPLARYLRFPLEVLGVAVLLPLLRLLPVDWASNLGGFVCRTIGPRLAINRRAEINLDLALPDLDSRERKRIVRGLWDNFGRTFCEYAHLGIISDPASGRVHWGDMEPILKLQGKSDGAILVSGHLANWEILPTTAEQHGIKMTVIVREPDNPHILPLVDKLRGASGGERVPKGQAGFRRALALLKEGRVLGLLIDQKLNAGLSVSFFGHEAMTTAAPAQLAMRLDCPLIPVRIRRTGSARFRVDAEAPIVLPKSGDRAADALAITQELNRILEGWIREKPEDWLWLHRRWPAEHYRTK